MYSDLASVYIYQADLDKAHELALKAVNYAEQSDYKLDLGYALISYARVLSMRDQWMDAKGQFLKALEKLESCDYRHFSGLAKFYFGEPYLRVGEHVSALHWFTEAKDDFVEIGLDHEIDNTKKLIDECTNLN